VSLLDNLAGTRDNRDISIITMLPAFARFACEAKRKRQSHYAERRIAHAQLN
jgi:hypothetical protein